MAVTERSQAASRAIDDLYRRHGAEVYRYALAVLGNRADAEDVTQTTFLNAYRAIEQGVRPRKPANWLLTIASNAIKQRFRQESARPRQVVLDQDLAGAAAEEDGPTVGELLTALSRIPPQQRQAIVLREFEGRSYKEIAAILGVTTSALETLLFRARRSLADELEHHLTCTDAQAAISRAVDGRIGRKERRRLREHLTDCPDCARFARMQQRHRTALKGLVVMPVPMSLAFLHGLRDTATAATLPSAAGASAAAAGVAGAGAAGVGAGGVFAGGAATGGGLFAGGIAVKAAAVVAAASVASGVGVVGANEIRDEGPGGPPPKAQVTAGKRLGQTAPRGVLVPGRGVAKGKATAQGQTKAAAKRPAHATRNATSGNPVAQAASSRSSSNRGSSSRSASSRSSSAGGASSRPTAAGMRGKSQTQSATGSGRAKATRPSAPTTHAGKPRPQTSAAQKSTPGAAKKAAKKPVHAKSRSKKPARGRGGPPA